MMIITILMTLMSFTFLFMKHPLSFGLILLSQTFLISMMTGMISMNFWFSYILFLIMVGGMLILFIYMTSIASNEKFLFSYKMSMTTLMIITTSLILTMLVDKFTFHTISSSYDLQKKSLILMKNLSMSKFTNMPSSMMLSLMIIYLLIALIAVIKISNIHHGPLRQKF